MKRYRRATWCALWIAAGALIGSPAWAQEKYTLLETGAAGDNCKVEDHFDMHVSLKVDAPGANAPEVPIGSSSHVQYTEAVLETDAHGHPTAIRRTYQTDQTVNTSPDGEKPEVSSLQGKTVTVRRKDTEVVVTCETGTISEKDRKSLEDAVDVDKEQFFPAHSVGLGEEWSLESKKLAKVFGGANKATIRGRLVEIVPFSGHKCAHVHVDLEIEANLSGLNGTATFKVSGDLYHALDIQRTLTVSLSGPVTMNGKSTQQGTTVTYSGAGTAQMKMTSIWLKVGGKPVDK